MGIITSKTKKSKSKKTMVNVGTETVQSKELEVQSKESEVQSKESDMFTEICQNHPSIFTLNIHNDSSSFFTSLIDELDYTIWNNFNNSIIDFYKDSLNEITHEKFTYLD